jgi:hypothetical protein
MAITFRATGAAASASSGDVSPGLPAGWEVGDLHVCVVAAKDNVACTMSSWTAIDSGTNNGTGLRSHSFYRVAEAGDGTPTVSHASGSYITAIICGFDGVDPTDPISVESAVKVNVMDSQITANGLTTDDDNEWLLFVGGIATKCTISAYSGSPSPTERADSPNTTNYPEICLASSAIATGGTVIGTRTANATGMAVNNGHQFTLRPHVPDPVDVAVDTGTLTITADDITVNVPADEPVEIPVDTGLLTITAEDITVTLDEAVTVYCDTAIIALTGLGISVDEGVPPEDVEIAADTASLNLTAIPCTVTLGEAITSNPMFFGFEYGNLDEVYDHAGDVTIVDDDPEGCSGCGQYGKRYAIIAGTGSTNNYVTLRNLRADGNWTTFSQNVIALKLDIWFDSAAFPANGYAEEIASWWTINGVKKAGLRVRNTLGNAVLDLYDSTGTRKVTGVYALSKDSWHTVEVTITNESTGRGDGVYSIIVDFDHNVGSGVNGTFTTQHAAEVSVGNRDRVQNDPWAIRVDDIVIDSASPGESYVTQLQPASNGHYGFWTGDWENACAVPPDEEASYIYCSSSSDKSNDETFLLSEPGLTTWRHTHTIMAAKAVYRVGWPIDFDYVSDSMVYFAVQGSEYGPTPEEDRDYEFEQGVFATKQVPWKNNPIDGQPWTAFDLTDIEIGISMVTLGHKAACAGMYLQILSRMDRLGAGYTCNTAVLTVQAQDIDVESAEEGVVICDTAHITVQANPVEVVCEAIVIPLDTAISTVTGLPIVVSTAPPVAVHLATGHVTVERIQATFVPGVTHIRLDTARVRFQRMHASIVGGTETPEWTDERMVTVGRESRTASVSAESRTSTVPKPEADEEGS